jgi:hypothetical protein
MAPILAERRPPNVGFGRDIRTPMESAFSRRPTTHREARAILPKTLGNSSIDCMKLEVPLPHSRATQATRDRSRSASRRQAEAPQIADVIRCSAENFSLVP